MKNFAQWTVMTLMPILGIVIGYYIHHNLKYFGVTFITMSDVIGCYAAPTFIMGLIGIYIGAIYLEDKIK